MKDGLAEVRVGATCLFDFGSRRRGQGMPGQGGGAVPALRGDPPKPAVAFAPDATGSGKQVLLMITTTALSICWRTISGKSAPVFNRVRRSALDMLKQKNWDLLVLSPGPGRPEDFAIARTIDAALAKKLPIFGVCLGGAGYRGIFRRPARPTRPAGAWPAIADPVRAGG